MVESRRSTRRTIRLGNGSSPFGLPMEIHFTPPDTGYTDDQAVDDFVQASYAGFRCTTTRGQPPEPYPLDSEVDVVRFARVLAGLRRAAETDLRCTEGPEFVLNRKNMVPAVALAIWEQQLRDAPPEARSLALQLCRSRELRLQANPRNGDRADVRAVLAELASGHDAEAGNLGTTS